MRVRLLGTSAGGGFPQWNCACAGCQASRANPQRVKPRTQSSVAVSADGTAWFLLNVSPDVRFQVEAFASLRPAGIARGTPIDGVLLTNGDLDHTLGLLLLREGEPLGIHATAQVRDSLERGFRAQSLLANYAGSAWHEPPVELAPLPNRRGQPSGLRFAAFPVPGKVPRYLEGSGATALDNVGYRIVDERTGGRLAFVPDCARIDPSVTVELERADLVLFDGTFWSEDELVAFGGRPAAGMAHQPIGGSSGTLAALAKLPRCRRVYVHLNNTNPVLLPDSPERAAVLAAGVEIGEDGQEFTL